MQYTKVKLELDTKKKDEKIIVTLLINYKDDLNRFKLNN